MFIKNPLISFPFYRTPAGKVAKKMDLKKK